MEGKTTMKALTIVEWGKLELKEVPIPKPKEGEVLVKVYYAPVNPSDVMSINGHYPLDLLPLALVVLKQVVRLFKLELMLLATK